MDAVDSYDNIDIIADSIFNKPPREPCSIELYLDGEGQSTETIFNILCILTLRGTKILFGEKNLIDLENDEFILLQRYVMSYGYEMVVTANDTDRSPWYYTENNIDIYRIKTAFRKYYAN